MIIGILEVIIIFILLILSRGNLIVGSKKRHEFYILAWIFLILIYLFKDNTRLPDMGTYELAYRYIDYGDFEIGYNTLVKVLNKISPNFWTIIVIYAYFVTTVNINLQKKYAVMPLFCLLLYVCTSFFSLFLIRQYIAMTICILTIPYLLNKKLFPFILLTLLASTFHRTAYVWLLVYFINYVNINFKWLGLITIGFIIFIKSLDLVIGEITMYISRMESYISQDEEQYTWKTLVISGAILGYVLFCYGRFLKTIEGFDKICFFMLVFSMLLDIINVMGTSFSAFYRIKPYCTMFIPYILPTATMRIRNPLIKLFCVIIISCLYIWLLIAGINNQRGWFGFIF